MENIRVNRLATWTLSAAVVAAGGLGALTVSAAHVAASRQAEGFPQSQSTAQALSASQARASAQSAVPRLALDRSGRKQVGKASFYANRYAGRTMADGTPMRLSSNNAASLTLPLGSTARVTNLETGQSAIVTIRDRGPYVAGRIVDLSPATARTIGIDRVKGIGKVEVAPLSVPQPDGTVWLASTALARNQT